MSHSCRTMLVAALALNLAPAAMAAVDSAADAPEASEETPETSEAPSMHRPGLIGVGAELVGIPVTGRDGNSTLGPGGGTLTAKTFLSDHISARGRVGFMRHTPTLSADLVFESNEKDVKSARLAWHAGLGASGLLQRGAPMVIPEGILGVQVLVPEASLECVLEIHSQLITGYSDVEVEWSYVTTGFRYYFGANKKQL